MGNVTLSLDLLVLAWDEVHFQEWNEELGKKVFKGTHTHTHTHLHYENHISYPIQVLLDFYPTIYFVNLMFLFTFQFKMFFQYIALCLVECT